MKRVLGFALLLGVSGGLVGCSVPSYRMPAGFSSTYSRGVTPPALPADALTALPPNYGGAGAVPPPVGVFGGIGGTSDLNLVDRWN